METERQRSFVTAIVVLTTPFALLGLALSDDPLVSKLIASFVIGLGTFGFAMNYKLYERWRFTRNRLHAFYRNFDESHGASILTITSVADSNYAHAARNIGTQLFRYSICVLISSIGIICLIHHLYQRPL